MIVTSYSEGSGDKPTEHTPYDDFGSPGDSPGSALGYLCRMLQHSGFWHLVVDNNGCKFWVRPKPQAPAVIPGFTQTAHDEFTAKDLPLTDAEQAEILAHEDIPF